MLDGFWTVEFGSSNGFFGGGVLWFNDGLIRGGDSGYLYDGTYTPDDGPIFRAHIQARPFVQGYMNVFGIPGQSFEMDLTGKVDGTTATAEGFPTGRPTLRFGAKLTKR